MEKIRDLGIWLPHPHYNSLPHPQGPYTLILHSKWAPQRTTYCQLHSRRHAEDTSQGTQPGGWGGRRTQGI